jgi:hypothetical protein
VEQGDIYPFIEVEGILFGERSKVLVDPSEEKLKNEFAGVTRTHIPAHAIIRIDEVETAGENRIIANTGGANVTAFPLSMPPGGTPDKS